MAWANRLISSRRQNERSAEWAGFSARVAHWANRGWAGESSMISGLAHVAHVAHAKNEHPRKK